MWGECNGILFNGRKGSQWRSRDVCRPLLFKGVFTPAQPDPYSSASGGRSHSSSSLVAEPSFHPRKTCGKTIPQAAFGRRAVARDSIGQRSAEQPVVGREAPGSGFEMLCKPQLVAFQAGLILGSTGSTGTGYYPLEKWAVRPVVPVSTG